jgi:hypothetical protein
MLHILPNQIETRWNGWTTGLNLDYTNGIYRFGDYGNSNKGNYLNIDDTNSKISTFNNSINIGLDLDLANGIYYFGGVTTSGGATGFKAVEGSRIATMGDVDGNGNGNNFGTDDFNETLFANGNLISTQGNPTFDRLKIRIGGTDYLIVLETA